MTASWTTNIKTILKTPPFFAVSCLYHEYVALFAMVYVIGVHHYNQNLTHTIKMVDESRPFCITSL